MAISAYENLKSRFDSAREGFVPGPYGWGGTFYNEKAPIRQEIERASALSQAEARTAARTMDASSNVSQTRSAFARGRASAKKKLFSRGGSGFGNIGRQEKANSEALGAKEKEAAELAVLGRQADPQQSPQTPSYSMTTTLGPRIWL